MAGGASYAGPARSPTGGRNLMPTSAQARERGIDLSQGDVAESSGGSDGDALSMPAGCVGPARTGSVEPGAPLVPGCCRTNANSSRAEPVPPEPHRLVADDDAPFVQEILDVSKRQREAHIHHHRAADDLGRRLEIAERGALGHSRTLPTPLPRRKPGSLDRTSLTFAGRVRRHAARQAAPLDDVFT